MCLWFKDEHGGHWHEREIEMGYEGTGAGSGESWGVRGRSVTFPLRELGSHERTVGRGVI